MGIVRVEHHNATAPFCHPGAGAGRPGDRSGDGVEPERRTGGAPLPELTRRRNGPDSAQLSGSRRCFRLRRPTPGHPVADAELGEDVGGVFGVVVQLAAQAAYGGAHGAKVSTRPALAESSAMVRYSMEVSGAGRTARLTRCPA